MSDPLLLPLLIDIAPWLCRVQERPSRFGYVIDIKLFWATLLTFEWHDDGIFVMGCGRDGDCKYYHYSDESLIDELMVEARLAWRREVLNAVSIAAITPLVVTVLTWWSVRNTAIAVWRQSYRWCCK